MIASEDEATKLWCPMARVPGALHLPTGEVERTGAQNRGYAMGGALHNCMCLGSKCMWWKWVGRRLRYVDDNVYDQVSPIEARLAHDNKCDNQVIARLGTCGRAEP